jgi:multiple sugar transport system ATP-binding protein
LATRTELKTLQRAIGITTVYVTHDQVEAMTLGDRIAVIKDGIIQQIGTPDEIYEMPANPFVATFIGSPPMSLIEAELVSEAGDYYLNFNGVRMKVPSSKGERARASGAGRCLLGIRPEDVTVITENVPPMPTFRATVVFVETLGRERLVHLETGKSTFSAFCREGVPEAGWVVEVAIDTKKIHLFPVM